MCEGCRAKCCDDVIDCGVRGAARYTLTQAKDLRVRRLSSTFEQVQIGSVLVRKAVATSVHGQQFVEHCKPVGRSGSDVSGT